MLASTAALPFVASLSIDKEGTFPTHKPVMTELKTNTLMTAAKMKVPALDLEEYMPRDEKGKLDIWRMRAAVDIAIVAREEDLEWAKEQKDPTKLWQILSDAAEEGLVGLIENEQLRRAAKGRGRHKVKHYSQVQTPPRDQALPQEVLITTELHATYVKAGRRLQNLEHIWRKGGHTGVVWCPRTRAIWQKVLSNPQNHGMDFERIQGWLDNPPGRHSAVFALQAAQIRVIRTTEEYQRKVRTARRDRNEKRYNEKKGDSNTYKALRAPPGRPLTFVLSEQGIITADPEEVDNWQAKRGKKVYDGMGGGATR